MAYVEQIGRPSENTDFSFLEKLKPPRVPLPRQLDRKVGFGAFDIYRWGSDHIKRSVDDWMTVDAQLVRFILSDAFKKIGDKYVDSVLQRVVRTGELIFSHSGGRIGWTVDIKDGFHMWHSNWPNGGYGTSPLTVNRLKGESVMQAQDNFFTGEAQNAAYYELSEHVISYFHGVRGLQAVSLMNEPGRKWPLPQSRRHVTDWIGRHTLHINKLLKQNGLDAAVTIEMERVGLVDQKRLRNAYQLGPQDLAIGVHLYGGFGPFSLAQLFLARRFAAQALFPIYVGEANSFEEVFGFKADSRKGLPHHTHKMIQALTIGDHLATTAVMFWHGDSFHPQDKLYIDVRQPGPNQTTIRNLARGFQNLGSRADS